METLQVACSRNAIQTASGIIKVVSSLAKFKQGQALLRADLAELHCSNRLCAFSHSVKFRDSFLTQQWLCFGNNRGMCVVYRVAKMCFVRKYLSTLEQHCTSMSHLELDNEKSDYIAHAIGLCAENRGSKLPHINLGYLKYH